MPSWDSAQFRKSVSERTQPAIDLLARVAMDAPRSVADLGCGPGNSTALLRQRWPAAKVVGVDSSAEMLDAARKAHPEDTWLLADIASWTPPAPCAVIFS